MYTLMNIARGVAAKLKALKLSDEHMARAINFMEFRSADHFETLRIWLDASVQDSNQVISGGDDLAKLGAVRVIALEPYLQEMLKNPPYPIDEVIGYGSTGEINKSRKPRTYGVIPLPAQKVSNALQLKHRLSAETTPENSHASAATSLRDFLYLRMIGQRANIDRVCKVLEAAPNTSGAGRPRACFLLAGPQASGKTVMAEGLVQALKGKYHVKRIDMSGYCYRDDPGLVGVNSLFADAQPGELTTFVGEHPQALVIFDNIHHAHPNVQRRLLSMLTHGHLRDEFWNSVPEKYRNEKGKKAEIDFSKAILIFTTSCGKLAYENPLYNQLECPVREREAMLMQALKREAAMSAGQYVCSELLHALASFQILPFAAMNLEGMRQLAQNHMREVIHRFGAARGCNVRVPDPGAAVDMLLFSLGPQANPRTNSVQAVEQILVDPVENGLPSLDVLRNKDLRLTISESAIKELNAIRQELGAEPLQTLFRKRRMLVWDNALTRSGHQVELRLDGLRLQAVKHGEDYCGDAAMQVDVPEVCFSNIAGHDKIKERLLQTATLMRQRDRLAGLDATLPKGLLLYGPPGTGKTMLAKAFANEADLPFMALSGTEIRDIDVMRRAFFRLRRYAPAVLFIDEIDALGKRGEGAQGDAVINQLLTEIDGFNSELAAPVFVIGATNMPGKIDQALLRSGRLDVHIEVPALNRDARQVFVERYRAIPGLQDIDGERLLATTSGLSGADLEKVRRETVLEMVRQGCMVATEHMLLDQISEVDQGRRREKAIGPKAREMTAWHEAGHAVLAYHLEPELPVRKISIEARANNQGAVLFDNELTGTTNVSADWVLHRLCIALAGRAAEARQAGDSGTNSGASQDMRRATELAYRAIFCWGLDEEVGTLALASDDANLPDLAALPEWGLRRLRGWMETADQKTGKYLEQYWGDVEKTALALLKHDTLDGNAFRALLAEGQRT